MPGSVLSRDSEQPLYEQLAALLGARIASGEWAPGDRLPAEPELMARHGLSRVTVRQALALLARGGQIVTRRGKGTFVAGPVMRHDLGTLKGFYDLLRDQGLEPQTELLEWNPSAGRDAAIPAGLDLPVRLRRRYALDARPFAVVEAWLPPAAAALAASQAARLTVYQIVERFLNERVASADLAIRSERASPGVARELGVPKGSPVLLMERTSVSGSHRVLEFMRIRIVPERYEFRLRVPGALEIASSVRPSAPAANDSEPRRARAPTTRR